MKTNYLMTLLLVLVLAACNSKPEATEQAEEINEEKFDDTPIEDLSEFMVQAYTNNLMLTEASQIASGKAMAQNVKEYALATREEHREIGQKMETLAQKLNITLPTALATADNDRMESLRQASGEEFDEEYTEMSEELHNKLIEEFDDVESEVQDPDAKTFVSQTLATLRSHEEQAEALEDQVD